MTIHRLEKLIDLRAIGNLLESYYNLTGISCTLIDTNQNALVAVGWPDICSQFHRQHPVSAQRCKRSNASMLCIAAPDMGEINKCQEYRCENGMLYSLLPIMVGSVHLGTLVAGKFFYKDEPLDRKFFSSLATELGFDQTSYFAALEQVPLFQRDYVCRNMQLLNNMVSILAETGLANLKLADRTQKLQQELKSRTEAEETLHIQAVLLEDEIAERQKAQEELQFSNRQLESANRALRLLSASNQTLLRSTNEDGLLNQVSRIAVEIGGYTTAWVGIAQHDAEKTVLPAASFGIEHNVLNRFRINWAANQWGGSAMATAIRTGSIQIRHNIQNNPSLVQWHDIARTYNHQSAIALPLTVHGEVIGALAIYSSEPYSFQQDEVDLLNELTLDLAFGIQTIRDRQAHEKAQGHVRQLAYYDRLTGLPNQYKFLEQLDRSIAAAAVEKHQFSLLLVDLNYLHEINETYGHALGDDVLIRVSRLLQEICSPACFIARFGGDFAIICPSINNVMNTATPLAEKIIAAIAAPFHLSGQHLTISANIGIVVYPVDGEKTADLLSKVDLAKLRARTSGGGFCFYRYEMGQQLARILKLSNHLENALQKNILQLFYQPKVDLFTNTLIGSEALLRWHDSELGWVSPAEFVPVAEARGMMDKLGCWVLKTACSQIKQWQDEGNPHPGKIAVNVSARQLNDPNFFIILTGIVEAAGLHANCLELELTESILMSDPEHASGILHTLKNHGFSLAIDDFGTGYSSLAYLKRFPVDTLKIDRAFVRDMLINRNDRAIVATIVAMARQLGLTTVAEGVEEQEQSLDLLELGCSQAQGFYFGRPVAADEFKQKWLCNI